MAKWDHPFRTTAKGSTNGGYARARIPVGFDEQQFRQIAELAQRRNKSFATVIRDLVDRSLRELERKRRG